MSLVFAVRWEPARDHTFIDFMAIDDENFEYEIEPVRLEVNTNDFSKFKQRIKEFFKRHGNAKLEYKSVIRRSPKGKPRSDSIDFHNTIQRIISDCKIKKPPRLSSDLSGYELTKFKTTLFKYNLVNQRRVIRFSLFIVSIICTGIRIVRAWSAIERVMACRIHQVA